MTALRGELILHYQTVDSGSTSQNDSSRKVLPHEAVAELALTLI